MDSMLLLTGAVIAVVSYMIGMATEKRINKKEEPDIIIQEVDISDYLSKDGKSYTNRRIKEEL